MPGEPVIIPRRDQLPFRTFEAAHRRLADAEHELGRARSELDEAFSAMRELGYAVSLAAGEVSPIPLMPVEGSSYRFSTRAAGG